VEALERYEAKTLPEVQAQTRLLNELHKQKSINAQVYHLEHKRLEELTYDLTYGQLPKNLTKAENIVQTQRFDWLSTGFIALSVIIGLWVIFPLLRKSLYYLRLTVIFTKKFILKILPFLPELFSFIKKVLLLINDAINYVFRGIITLIEIIPKPVWELLFYLLLIWLLFIYDYFYLRLAITLILTLTWGSSLYHHLKFLKPNTLINLYLLLMSFLWATTAYLFQSAIFGFIAIGFINAFLGFFISIEPATIWVGFKEKSQRYIFRSSLISLALLLTGWLIFYSHLLPKNIGMELFMFAPGLYFFVPLSFYTAILIISGMWFDKDDYYISYNIYAFLTGLSLLLLAYLYTMGFLFWIGTIFTIWLLVAKYYELIWKKIDTVYALSIIAIILALSGYYIKNNLEAIVIFMTPIL